MNFLRRWFSGNRWEENLNEELRFHLEKQTALNIAAGMAPKEARRQAVLEFGAVEGVKEGCREERRAFWLETLWTDVRYGLRLLRKSPGFTAVAILTLAIGIGANTAIFSVVDAILFKPLPYPHANRLAIILSSFGNEHRAPFSGYDFKQLRDNSRLFEQIGGIWVTNAAITTDDPQPEPVKLADVTDGFLSLFCTQPALGRLFAPQDLAPKAPTVVVISNGLWRRKFGANPHIVGKLLHIGPDGLTIVGVLPADFHLIFPDDSNVPATPDVYVLLARIYTEPGGAAFLHLAGRLRRGTTFAQAQSETDAIAARLRESVKDYAAQNYKIRVFPLQQDDTRNVRGVLMILFSSVGLVVLIACANVANLLLARATDRQHETVVRAALGATRARIVRQLLTESVVLALLGGLAAIAVGWTALQGLLALRPESLLRLGAIHLDSIAFVFTLLIALVTGVIFGIGPALGAARFDLSRGLKNAGRSSSRKHGSKVALILGEVALTSVLLTGGGLLARTFVSVLRVDPGFQPAGVLSFNTLGGDYSFLHRLQKDLAALPGVQSVSVVSHVPFDNSYGNWYDFYWPEGAPLDQQSTVMADYRSVLPGYFTTMHASLIQGRDFTDDDDVTHQHVIIVDDALAQRAWPGKNPLGKKLHISDSPVGFYQFQDDWAVVVGVVHHVQYHSLTVMVRPQIYVPYQLAPRPISFVLRASVPLPGLVVPIRSEISKLNKTVAVTRFISLSDLVAGARSQTRFVTFLSGTLAALALFLSCIGVYGVTSYLTLSRTSEIGIRMALGASPGDVRKLVLRSGMTPVIFGCAIGIALSLPLTPLLSSLLFGVRPFDLPTLAAAALFLFSIGFFACYTPTRRAMRVDPMVALRYE
jgi:predicted permease